MAHLGRREGWTLRPPYSAFLRIRDGTKRPKETAIMRLISSFCGSGSCVQSVTRSNVCLK